MRGIIGTDPITGDGRDSVAFVGRSNVGKSSLINALCNKNTLVKTSSKPGKTTEINFFLINDSFYFVDLPGYGYARVTPKEKEQIRARIVWYLTTPEVTLRKVVLVVDGKVGLTAFDMQMITILKEHKHQVVIAVNKIDALNQKETAKQLALITKEAQGIEVVPCSALEHSGADLLRSAL